MKDWAVILGASSGFGAATCRELASRGINIYGVHLDRRATMNSVNINPTRSKFSTSSRPKTTGCPQYYSPIFHFNISPN
jgi:hypothetical protein